MLNDFAGLPETIHCMVPFQLPVMEAGNGCDCAIPVADSKSDKQKRQVTLIFLIRKFSKVKWLKGATPLKPGFAQQPVTKKII
jgi:hypothetical protein